MTLRSLLVIVAVLPASAAADRTCAVGASTSHEVGIFAASSSKLGGSFACTFADRAYVGAALALGVGTKEGPAGASLVVHEELVGLGLVLHASRALDVVVGWRLGHAAFHGDNLDRDVLATTPLLRFDLAIDASWILQLEPLGVRAYWVSGWATSLGAQVALAYKL
jgi:hypothetical protein